MLFAGQYSEDQDYNCDGTSNYRETNAAADAELRALSGASPAISPDKDRRTLRGWCAIVFRYLLCCPQARAWSRGLRGRWKALPGPDPLRAHPRRATTACHKLASDLP